MPRDSIHDVSAAVDRVIAEANALADLREQIVANDPRDARAWATVAVLKAKLAEGKQAVGKCLGDVERRLKDLERELITANPAQGDLFRDLPEPGVAVDGAVHVPAEPEPVDASSAPESVPDGVPAPDPRPADLGALAQPA